MPEFKRTHPKKVIIFTANFPYGNTETFLGNEIEFLSRTFDKLILVPCSYPKGNKQKKTLPSNVKCFPPYLSRNISLRILKAIFNFAPGLEFLSDIFLKKICFTKNGLISWLNNFICCRTFLISKGYKTLRRIVDKGDVLYFYWGVGTASCIPFLDLHCRIFLRLHGADVYRTLNGEYNYLPFRDKIYQRVDCLLTISEGIKDYLIENYYTPGLEKRIVVSRLGTLDFGLNPHIVREELVIVSCSQIIPIKRIERIVQSLNLIKNRRILWHHFGDGQLRDTMISKCSKLPNNISAIFHGHLPNSEILKFYSENHVDIFVNVSSTEGIPVSIMEAMSAGIIPIATNAGDTRELVDQSCGYLLDVEFNNDHLAHIILNIRQNDFENKRKNARHKWGSFYNGEINYTRLGELLSVNQDSEY